MVMAAVDLQQRSLLGHPFPRDPVHGRTVLPSAEQAGAVEETAYRLVAQVNALSLREILHQVVVAEADVFLAGQVYHCDSDIPGNGVSRLAAPVAVGQSGGSIPPVGRKDSAELAIPDPQKFGRLSPWQSKFLHAVEYLETCSLSPIQCPVLHRRIFFVTSLCGHYRREMT